MIINEYIYASNGSYISVTVTGKYTAGDTVTATSNGTTHSASLGADGKAMIPVDTTGTYIVTYTIGGLSASKTVDVTASGFTYPITIASPLFKFSMDFDADVFMSDPTGCLTYADDCTGYTPVSYPPSSLGNCQILGDWTYSANGTSDNPLLNGCFYATFKDNGNGLELYEKLNPNNLTQKIATWNGTSWVASSGASSITTYDTMFCIPTIYMSSTATKLSLSNISTEGTAYAHTIDNHVYDYLAIGVYESIADNGIAYSCSGSVHKGEWTRNQWRTACNSKSVKDGYALQWNFHHLQLWRMMTILAAKSFNGQTQIGNGGYSYSSNEGVCNTYGPFAGATTDGTAVKAYIENPWGHDYELVDDFYNRYGWFWAGQRSVPTDTTDDKERINTYFSASGYPNAIVTDIFGWGLGTNANGSTTTGTCDQFITSAGDGRNLGVGGYGASATSGSAGISYIDASFTPDWTIMLVASRMAFVFDL